MVDGDPSTAFGKLGMVDVIPSTGVVGGKSIVIGGKFCMTDGKPVQLVVNAVQLLEN